MPSFTTNKLISCIFALAWTVGIGFYLQQQKRLRARKQEERRKQEEHNRQEKWDNRPHQPPPSDKVRKDRYQPSTPQGVMKSFDDLGNVEYVQSYELCSQEAIPHPVQTGSEQDQIVAKGQNVVLVMVGLPGRGKSALSAITARYLEFFHGVETKLFNVSTYRKEHSPDQARARLFDPDNTEGATLLLKYNALALEDLLKYINSGDEGATRVAFFDAPNVSRERREWVLEQLKQAKNTMVIFVEMISETMVEPNNMSHLDAAGIKKASEKDDKSRSLSDQSYLDQYLQRISQYERCYQPLCDTADEHLHFIRICERGKRVTVNNINGYLQSKIVQFLMSCSRLTTKSLYLTRHGQSTFNLEARVGGNPGLTKLGEAYSKALAGFARTEICTDKDTGEAVPARLWTSTLKRTQLTVRYFDHPTLVLPDGHKWVQMNPRAWRNLDEIYAGSFDCLTYDEITEYHPQEAADRTLDKLAYRYPKGESYLDVIQRLEPIVHDIERRSEPLLVCSHQGILRMLLAFYTNVPREDAPRLTVKLNHVYKLTPSPYGCKQEIFDLMPSKAAGDDGQTNL